MNDWENLFNLLTKLRYQIDQRPKNDKENDYRLRCINLIFQLQSAIKSFKW